MTAVDALLATLRFTEPTTVDDCAALRAMILEHAPGLSVDVVLRSTPRECADIGPHVEVSLRAAAHQPATVRRMRIR